MHHYDNEHDFLQGRVNKQIVTITLLFSLIYFAVLTLVFPIGNKFLFTALVAGEVFHIWQVIGYGLTTFRLGKAQPAPAMSTTPVDVFVTVCGEPVEIVRETIQAIKAFPYVAKKIYILNDGLVAKKDNWREMEDLATELGVTCITRDQLGGAKAGNINNALRQTSSPLVAIFDADHVPKTSFLHETLGYFSDPKMGFVQTPQYYKNFDQNDVTRAAWEQQTLFFGPIMRGKNNQGAVFMCGTNMVIRRTALMEAGGMCETNIAEDFLTSLFIHQKGWKSVYVPKVLARGLAPEDFLSYYKQQFRWARGSLEVIFKYNPLLRRGLSTRQKFQYITSASYYLSGIVTLIDILLPLIFLFTGAVPVVISSMGLAFVFIPYIFLNILVLQATSGFSYTFKAISYSLSSFALHIRAIIAVLLNEQTKFSVTSKKQLEGNFMYLAIPHILYTITLLAGTILAVHRYGLTASVITNVAWGVLSVLIFAPYIYGSMPDSAKEFFGKLLHGSPRRLDVEVAKGERSS